MDVRNAAGIPAAGLRAVEASDRSGPSSGGGYRALDWSRLLCPCFHAGSKDTISHKLMGVWVAWPPPVPGGEQQPLGVLPEPPPEGVKGNTNQALVWLGGAGEVEVERGQRRAAVRSP
ncbi:unnamed protein product [Boreogadus saida]